MEHRQPAKLDTTLPVALGLGEREAISLAVEVNADLLLVDERAGRLQAEKRGITVAGTLAFLLEASLRHPSDFPALIQKLRGYGFRVSPAVESAVLARYESAQR